MAATHHAAQRPQYSIPPPPPPPSGAYNNDDLRLPSIKDLAFQYDRPRHEIPQAASTQGPPEYSASSQERSARHTQAWGRMSHAMPAPSAIPAHQPHTQHQHTPPLSAGHEIPSKPNEYVVKHDSGGYMTPGIPLSAQVAPVPGSVSTGPGVRSDDHSQGQNKRARSSSLTPIVSPRDSRPPHAAYPPQYPAYQAVPPPSPYNQMSPVSAAPPSTHPHPLSSHEHMHHHANSASVHPGFISYQQYIPPRPSNIPPQHVHPHAPQHTSHAPPSHAPSHVPQHAPQHAPPPPPSHPQVSHPVPYSSPAPAPPPPQEHWEQQQQHAQPVTPVHHHSHHHPAPPQPTNHGHVHPHPQYSRPPPPPPPPPQVPPAVAQAPQQQPPPPPPQHHAAYQQPVHPLPPPPLPQQQPTATRTASSLPTESEVRTSSYALPTTDKSMSHEKTMSEIVSLCSMLYEFATRYSALNGALPHVQPAQHEVMEMARRANEVVRLLEVLRRMNAQGNERHKVENAAVVSSPDDHRPPKRPWEDMSQDGQAQADDSNTYPESFSNVADIDKTTAEQDMEIIRTKRASTTAGAAASAGQPKSKYRKRSSGQRATPPGKCHSCNIRETPEWRRGPDGARTLCNACGLHYAKLMRKQTKLNSNGEPPPPIDMDTLRASTRAADADKSNNRPKHDENTSPTAHTPQQHHQGSFQVVTMMPSQPENPPSSDANNDPTHQQSILPSPSNGSMHLPPPPPPWAASVSRTYSQPFQTQSFVRTSHTSPR